VAGRQVDEADLQMGQLRIRCHPASISRPSDALR
jgi:hypothetical protein